MNVLIWLLTAVHVVVALIMIVIVLMQKSSDQGVGAAFGGGMTDTVFGADTTNALQRITIWCACALLATTIILASLHARRARMGTESPLKKMMQTTPAAMPTAPTGPSPLMPEAEPSPAPAAPATTEAPAAPATPAPAPAPAPAK